MKEFLEALASKEPTPGGGGASALVAAVSCSLCSMVANLTTGKKKYAQYLELILWQIHLEEQFHLWLFFQQTRYICLG